MADEFAYDVLVVGLGSAACCAAMAAQDRKVRVGILEKAPKGERGGNSTLTAHMRFPYNSVEDFRPLMKNVSDKELYEIGELLPTRTEAELWDELMRVTQNQSDQEMLQIHVTEALKTVHWLADKGHDWVPSYGNRYGGNVVWMNGGGFGLQQRNFSYLERDGASFHYETAATELLQDDQGRVTGVRALTPNGFVNFRAKAVVLACGGFEGNAEMRARYLGPRWDSARIRGVPYNTGDGLRMALDIGAMPYGSWTTCHASPQDFEMPPFQLPSRFAGGSGEWSRYSYPYSVMVNNRGARFVDEADDIQALTYAKMGRAILAQPGGIAFEVFDAKARKHNLVPEENYQNATGGISDTLEGLAEVLDIDAATFVETVKRFNAAIQPGPFVPNPFKPDGKHTADIDPRKSNFAISIEEPPFEAFAVRCGVTFTFGGLKVNPKTGQAQHVAGRPIPGLYAAGEMVGGLFHGNYASGSGMMAGATFGRIAGTHAAEAATND